MAVEPEKEKHETHEEMLEIFLGEKLLGNVKMNTQRQLCSTCNYVPYFGLPGEKNNECTWICSF